MKSLCFDAEGGVEGLIKFRVANYESKVDKNLYLATLSPSSPALPFSSASFGSNKTQR